jgi:DNA-binding MarR family transcriptional regulator
MYSNTIQHTRAYHEVLFDTNLNPTEYRVYMALSAFDIKNNGIIDNLCYAKLGELIGLSPSRTRQVISSLVEKGYVIKQHNITNTRNKYILPKKIEQDMLLKLSTKIEISPDKDENSSTASRDESLPIYSKDLTDDDNIDQTIEKIKKEEGEEVVRKALEKMEKYSIQKSGFITYLKKTIHTIKNQGKKLFKNTYKNYNKKKTGTFNNFKQRDNYNFGNLQEMLLGRMEYNEDLLYT